MKKKLIVIAALTFALIGLAANPAKVDALTVNLSCDGVGVAGGTVEFKIMISGFRGETVDGFAIRLNYDQSVLTDPRVITGGTLSNGLTVEEGFPADGVGNFSLGVLSGLDAFNDGVLIKVRFTVAATHGDLKTLGFVQPGVKTLLYDGSLNPIAATWINANFM